MLVHFFTFSQLRKCRSEASLACSPTQIAKCRIMIDSPLPSLVFDDLLGTSSLTVSKLFLRARLTSQPYHNIRAYPVQVHTKPTPTPCHAHCSKRERRHQTIFAPPRPISPNPTQPKPLSNYVFHHASVKASSTEKLICSVRGRRAEEGMKELLGLPLLLFYSGLFRE